MSDTPDTPDTPALPNDAHLQASVVHLLDALQRVAESLRMIGSADELTDGEFILSMRQAPGSPSVVELLAQVEHHAAVVGVAADTAAARLTLRHGMIDAKSWQ